MFFSPFFLVKPMALWNLKKLNHRGVGILEIEFVSVPCFGFAVSILYMPIQLI